LDFLLEDKYTTDSAFFSIDGGKSSARANQAVKCVWAFEKVQATPLPRLV
jgi:hypothetical protein